METLTPLLRVCLFFWRSSLLAPLSLADKATPGSLVFTQSLASVTLSHTGHIMHTSISCSMTRWAESGADAFCLDRRYLISLFRQRYRLCIRMVVSVHVWSVSQWWLAACGCWVRPLVMGGASATVRHAVFIICEE